MALNENIVTGRKFKKLIDEANNLWQKMSFWTKASDIEFDDGSTAEIKIGAINGVTDSLTSTSSNIAASAAAVKALNDKVTELNSNIHTCELTDKAIGSDGILSWYNRKYIKDIQNIMDPVTVTFQNLEIGRLHKFLGWRNSRRNSIASYNGCVIDNVIADGFYIEVDFTPFTSDVAITFNYYLNDIVLVN